jgi:hypothetical protein
MPMAFIIFSFKPICKSDSFMNYKRTIVGESSITRMLFKVHTLFLTREAHKGVKFLTRWSL